MTKPLAPIERSTNVPWTPDDAFERFTAGFGLWWPVSTHSVGGRRVSHVVFECQVGGRIFEQFTDGRRYQWGRITTWEPPRRVAFTWHPSREEREAQDVEVRFEAVPGGSRVVLTSSGWEKLGRRAARERKGYAIGWGSILEVFAGRRTAVVLIFAVIAHMITFFLRITGRLERAIDTAGGRMAPANAVEGDAPSNGNEPARRPAAAAAAADSSTHTPSTEPPT
jgi:uncharacterized protein YndB with AHSA1/START domain